MTPTVLSPLAILADDLTGACDTGTLFAGPAPVPVTLWPRAPRPAPVRVLDTESRALDRDGAARRVASAAALVGPARYFKKIDSTLRGSIGAEVDALLNITGAPCAVLTPAFPAQGRVVVQQVLRVGGVPVAETAAGADPAFPRPGVSSVIECLRPATCRPLDWIPLAEVRGSSSALAARLGRMKGAIAVADAATDDDLAALVDACLGADPAPLLVGAAGLARAVAARLGLLAAQVHLPPGRRWLVVAGSRHPATRQQVAVARASGIRVLATAEADTPDEGEASRRLAEEARAVLSREAFDLVAVTGGRTAAALWEVLEAEEMDLVGPPAPGLSLGYLRGPRHPALAVLTKAGGFGTADLFVSLFRESGR
jgi:uncharacterized protein YgbK (DUF1537 family)